MAEKDSPVLGLHLEGHYFNMKMAGGQIPENIKNPDPEEYIPLLGKRIVSSAGMPLRNFRERCSLEIYHLERRARLGRAYPSRV